MKQTGRVIFKKFELIYCREKNLLRELAKKLQEPINRTEWEKY